MRYSKITPVFSGCEEIRMGSSFQICELDLKGRWTPNLPNYDWQNIYAQSDNKRYLALVAWDTENNEPGFKIIIIDSKNKSMSETKRINGCCESIEWSATGFTYRTYSYLSENDFSDSLILIPNQAV